MFPSNFFQCARKSIDLVFERHIFMPERLIFLTDVTQNNSEFNLIWYSPDVALPRPHPVSASQTKVQSPAAWFPSNVYHARDIKITARQLETAARRYLVKCAAAQLRGNIADVVKV